jgi:hypothetical protein
MLFFGLVEWQFNAKPVNMKIMDKTLTNLIIDKLNADDRFYHQGRGANLGVWSTSPPDVLEMIDLKKNLAKKGYGAFMIRLYKEDEQGLEMKIEMYVPSHCEWDTFFEGFVETESDFDRLMVMLGLK